MAGKLRQAAQLYHIIGKLCRRLATLLLLLRTLLACVLAAPICTARGLAQLPLASAAAP